jgi:hypothetical protein
MFENSLISRESGGQKVAGRATSGINEITQFRIEDAAEII